MSRVDVGKTTGREHDTAVVIPGRRPAPRFYMPELDGLRFVAFLLVFVHHLPFPKQWTASSVVLDRIHAFGWIGVDIFLVLSAYLLTRLAIREHAATGNFDVLRFYGRRVMRIWPLYFMGLLIGFFAYPLASAALGLRVRPPMLDSIRDHLLPYALFAGNFSYAAFRDTLGLYKSLWTVSLEEQFYLVFPLVMLVLLPLAGSRKPFWMLAAIALVAVLFRIQVQMAELPYPWIWVSPLTRLDPFAAGMALALIAERRPALPVGGRALLIAALCGFLLICSFPQLGKSDHAIWQLAISAAASALLLAASREGLLARLLAARPLVILGKLSFGLYVYHRFAIDIFVGATRGLGITAATPLAWCAAAILCFVATVAAAWTSYVYFESIFLRRKRRWEVIPSRPVSIAATN